MKKGQAIVLAMFLVFAVNAQCATSAPLKLVERYKFPSDIEGHFDHLIVDLQGRRLFTTPQAHKSIDVFDLQTGKLIHSIGGIGDPHTLLYLEDLDRLYVTDGSAGELKIFDGKTYKLIKGIQLYVDADSLAYDAATKYIYVVSGGGDAKMTYTTISIINTTSGEKIGEIKVDGDALECMALEKSSSKMYVNNKAKNRVDVLDRNTRTIIASWPVTLGKLNDPIALDEANHRLFVACRSGQIVVFDTNTGKELQSLPIGRGVDDLVFDSASKRLYAPCGGSGTVDVYKQTDPDHYKSIGKVPSGPLGKTGRLVPELNRYFVAVPKHGNKNAEILVYEVQ
jgi:DNA-binding beta-propeller fold protein YncE